MNLRGVRAFLEAGPRPTARGWGIGTAGVVLLIVATITTSVTVLFLGLLCVILVTGSLIALALRRPGIEVARNLVPEDPSVGDDVSVVLRLRATGAGVPPGDFADTLSPGLGGPDRGAWLDGTAVGTMPALPPTVSAWRGAEVRVGYQFRAASRGEHTVGPFQLEVFDALGLARAGMRAGGVSRLMVLPRVVDLDAAVFASPRGEGSENAVLPLGIPGQDPLLSREYRTGDAMRRVNWRETARRDRLMVRQEEHHDDPEALLVLDTLVLPRAAPRTAMGRRYSGSSRDGDDALDAGVDLAASIGMRLVDAGYSLELVTTAASHAGTGERFASADGGTHLLTALAPLRRSVATGDPWATTLTTALRRRARPGPLVIVATGGMILDPDMMERLVHEAAPAILLACDSSQGSGADQLRGTGWLVATFSPGQSLAAAWGRLVLGRGRVRT